MVLFIALVFFHLLLIGSTFMLWLSDRTITTLVMLAGSLLVIISGLMQFIPELMMHLIAYSATSNSVRMSEMIESNYYLGMVLASIAPIGFALFLLGFANYAYEKWSKGRDARVDG